MSTGLIRRVQTFEYPSDPIMLWALPWLTLSFDASSSLVMRLSALIKASAFSLLAGLTGGQYEAGLLSLNFPVLLCLYNSHSVYGSISTHCFIPVYVFQSVLNAWTLRDGKTLPTIVHTADAIYTEGWSEERRNKGLLPARLNDNNKAISGEFLFRMHSLQSRLSLQCGPV